MNPRLHPQDLRAIMAACLAPRLSSMSTYQACLDGVEILLRHIERTAKPSEDHQCPQGPSRSDIQKKALDAGGKYWRAPDAHGVKFCKESAIDFMQEVLGVEVEIEGDFPRLCDPEGDLAYLDEIRKLAEAQGWNILEGGLVQWLDAKFQDLIDTKIALDNANEQIQEQNREFAKLNAPSWKCQDCGQVNTGWATECGRCEKLRSDLVPNPCPGLHVVDRTTFDRLVMFSLGEQLRKREADLVQAVKDEGTKAERERIINLLVYGQEHSIRAFKCHEGGATLANELEVRAALEAKP